MADTKKMKELFTENELSPEQLEEIAGGTSNDMADDSRFLNVLLRGRPGQCNRYGEYKCGSSYTRGDIKKEVEAAWASVGIKADVNWDAPCFYWLDGEFITQIEAWEHAEKVVGKRLKKTDWYWPD